MGKPERVCVITGGTRGIGAAVARILAQSPTDGLVLAYRHDGVTADRLVAELRRPDFPVQAVHCDVSDDDQVRDLFAVADELGRVRQLVNCAGVLEQRTSFDNLTSERWARVLGVNVIGLASCCRMAIARMRTQGQEGAAIVNLSSRAAVLGSPGEYVDYAASKAAVDTLTRGLALEVAAMGIRVNSVRPGIIDTDMHGSGGDPDRARRLGPAQPVGRAGTPTEVAKAVAWLLSDDASFITGTTLDVAGGR